MKIPALQLALDCSSTEEAIRDCQTGVVDEIDILECGYSLIAAEGARHLRRRAHNALIGRRRGQTYQNMLVLSIAGRFPHNLTAFSPLL